LLEWNFRLAHSKKNVKKKLRRHNRVPQELGTPCRFLPFINPLWRWCQPQISRPQVSIGRGRRHERRREGMVIVVRDTEQKKRASCERQGRATRSCFFWYSSSRILEECLLRRLILCENWLRLHARKRLSFLARYHHAKETKHGGKGGRESECFIVPLNSGTSASGPGGGKGRRVTEPFEGSMAGALKPDHQVNTTRTRSHLATSKP
jgi:hypothetical protein